MFGPKDAGPRALLLPAEQTLGWDSGDEEGWEEVGFGSGRGVCLCRGACWKGLVVGLEMLGSEAWILSGGAGRRQGEEKGVRVGSPWWGMRELGQRTKWREIGG